MLEAWLSVVGKNKELMLDCQQPAIRFGRRKKGLRTEIFERPWVDPSPGEFPSLLWQDVAGDLQPDGEALVLDDQQYMPPFHPMMLCRSKDRVWVPPTTLSSQQILLHLLKPPSSITALLSSSQQLVQHLSSQHSKGRSNHSSHRARACKQCWLPCATPPSHSLACRPWLHKRARSSQQ
jgi:hypothetical protein